MAVGMQQHIGGFDVEVTGVLLVQAVGRTCDGCAELGNLIGTGSCAGLGVLVEQVLQGRALYMLHHQIRQRHQIARRHKTWHMPSVQHLQDLVLDFKAHDVLSAIASAHARHFHDHGKRCRALVCVRHLVNMRHAARMQTRANAKAVDVRTSFQALQRPVSKRCAKNSGRPAWRMLRAAAMWS